MTKSSTTTTLRSRIKDMVKKEGWGTTVAVLIENLKAGTYTGEDVRLAVTEQGLPDPSHHNAWGTAIRNAKTRGILIETGEYRPMISKSSHGRKTVVYMKQ